MRPPHYTGEDMGRGHCGRVAILASMRPPHYTGEDLANPSPAAKEVVLQ